jgi:hypothetical protein
MYQGIRARVLELPKLAGRIGWGYDDKIQERVAAWEQRFGEQQTGVDRRSDPSGVRPRSPPCNGGVIFPDQQPLLQRSSWDSNPVIRAYQVGVLSAPCCGWWIGLAEGMV